MCDTCDDFVSGTGDTIQSCEQECPDCGTEWNQCSCGTNFIGDEECCETCLEDQEEEEEEEEELSEHDIFMLCKENRDLYLSERELEEMYDEVIDDCYPPYVIGGATYYPSNILKECDPVAYRCGLSDWLSAECSEGNLVEVNGTYYMRPEQYEALKKGESL